MPLRARLVSTQARAGSVIASPPLAVACSTLGRRRPTRRRQPAAGPSDQPCTAREIAPGGPGSAHRRNRGPAGGRNRAGCRCGSARGGRGPPQRRASRIALAGAASRTTRGRRTRRSGSPALPIVPGNDRGTIGEHCTEPDGSFSVHRVPRIPVAERHQRPRVNSRGRPWEAFQAEDRGFEPRLPLIKNHLLTAVCCMPLGASRSPAWGTDRSLLARANHLCATARAARSSDVAPDTQLGGRRKPVGPGEDAALSARANAPTALRAGKSECPDRDHHEQARGPSRDPRDQHSFGLSAAA